MSKTQLKLFIGMHRSINYIDRETSKIHKKYKLTTPQFGVLEALYHKGDLCVGEVQEKILSTSGTIPVIIKNLEKRGYICSKKDPNDKRRVILSITNEGKKLMDIVYPENEEKIMELINLWNEEDQKNLLRIFKEYGEKIEEKSDK